MCRKMMMFLLLAAFCSVSFAGELDTVKWTGNGGTTDWHTNTNWLRFGTQEGWAGGTAVPEAWQRVYVGMDYSGDIILDISSGTAASEAFYVGMATDTADSVTVNIASGATWSNQGYKFGVAESKATFNVDGTLSMRQAKFDGATVNIGDGGTLRVNTNLWYFKTGTSVTVAEGGLISLADDGGYGWDGGFGAGAIDLEEGGLLRLDGDLLTDADNYITTGFVVSSTMSASQWLESSYDGSNTYISVVPEPATLALLGLGGLFIRRKRA